jgi:two-component system sensor histidine kinase QseC
VREAALAHCIEACDRMTRLVSQLLVLARADELGALEQAQPCRLADIARDVLAELTPAATRSGVTMALDVADEGEIRGDPGLLTVAVRNLVDNAIRYGRTEVGVDVHKEGAFAVIAVTDDGPGVPVDALPQLGRRFYRAPGAQGVGRGLGLSIVRRIAELHGGKVDFRNHGTGNGLVATVSLTRS